MPTLFRKTAKGQTEIETRAHRLAPRLRGLLILVDGKRDASALAALVPQQADALLAELLTLGFVEALPEAAAAPALPPKAMAEASASVRPTPMRSEDFETLRRNAVRALNDALGPAAETIALRIERTRNMAELQPQLMQGAQAVANMRGRAAAEAYAAKFLAQE
ncbi:MAG: hypothetical protein IPF94_09120 [Betaproteobacteria bacterium]|nr:hypothetical protein [Betaproteobacteria bacterium]